YPDGQFLELYKQLPDHSFVDVTLEAGLAFEGAGQISLADYDRDGDLDIIVGNSFHRLGTEQTRVRKQRVALFENKIGQNNNWLVVKLVGKGKGASNR